MFIADPVACVASVSVGFRAKKDRRTGFSGWERGRGRKETRVLPSSPLPPRSFFALAPFFARLKHQKRRSSVLFLL